MGFAIALIASISEPWITNILWGLFGALFFATLTVGRFAMEAAKQRREFAARQGRNHDMPLPGWVYERDEVP